MLDTCLLTNSCSHPLLDAPLTFITALLSLWSSLSCRPLLIHASRNIQVFYLYSTRGNVMCRIQPLAALSFSHEKCRNNWREIRAPESSKPGSFLTSVQLDNRSNEVGVKVKMSDWESHRNTQMQRLQRSV